MGRYREIKELIISDLVLHNYASDYLLACNKIKDYNFNKQSYVRYSANNSIETLEKEDKLLEEKIKNLELENNRLKEKLNKNAPL